MGMAVLLVLLKILKKARNKVGMIDVSKVLDRKDRKCILIMICFQTILIANQLRFDHKNGCLKVHFKV